MEATAILETSDAQRNYKNRRVKTFTGCWDCRARKVKCDEALPECTPCSSRGFSCSGYQPVLVWVPPNHRGYEPGRRRALKSHLTWAHQRIYDSKSVDILIAQCDLIDPGCRDCHKSAGPFTVFPSTARLIPPPRVSPSETALILNDFGCNQPSENSAFLFHHYTQHIAPNMMPFEHPRNPWQSFYPLAARCGNSRRHKSLLHAMLAQAAGNLAHLGCEVGKMSALAVKYYSIAVEDLRKGLDDAKEDFSMVLASVLTLIMAEVYSGKSKAWRLHLNGGWNFINSYLAKKPWQWSEAAWLTSQSLCLLKVRCDTMQTTKMTAAFRNPGPESAYDLISSVASRADFGFTVGASPVLMSCIIETTQLAPQILESGVDVHRGSIDVLYQRLQACVYTHSSLENQLIQLHHRIFQLGAIIYFHRSIFNSPPRILKPYINELLTRVNNYRESGGGYITLWPVFITAVEAYEESHQMGFRQWLDACEGMGAANRMEARKLIEAIWSERTGTAKQLGVEIERGDIVVDWREVMAERQLDILLV